MDTHGYKILSKYTLEFSPSALDLKLDLEVLRV
jgi:hypothetical protein